MPASRSRILVVDDDPVNVMIMEEILSGDYELLTASNGEEALELARREIPDLVLLDIMMPGINGYDVCKQMRAVPDLRRTKILLVSAKALAEERVRGYRVGADDYVTKPFDHDELSAKIRVFLQLASLEEIDELRSDLITVLSHETRTPLNGILPAAQILAEEDSIPAAERRTLAEVICRSGQRLLTILERGMLLSELRAGTLPIQPARCCLAELYSEVLERLEPPADRDRCRLVVTGPTNSTADGGKLGLAIQIVLENALRFGGQGTPVETEIGGDVHSRTITVLDRGEGIPAGRLRDIFEPFAQRMAGSQPVGGGWSLALALEIARAHGGDVSATNREGCGAAFTIRLPVGASDAGKSPTVRA